MPNEPGRIDIAFSGKLGAFSLNSRFSAPAAGVTAIFGPSGCGKTTVARCIAGLRHLREGFCAVDGDIWQDRGMFRPPHLRQIGYVFQEASLFPHLSVRGNLLYGALTHEPAPISFGEVVDLLGIERLLDRSPNQLSGGERQRVAIGRALLSQPKLLLMDEPLAALDSSAKSEILPFLERLHNDLSIPMLYISHDMAEIERLADQIVLMQNGVVTAAGPLHILQSNPALPLADSRHAAVSLDGTVSGYDGRYGLLALRIKGGRLLVPAPPTEPGARQRLRIPACDVSIASTPLECSILNILPARIISQSPLGGGEVTIVLALGADGAGAKILARITRRSRDMLGLTEGMDVFAQIKSVSLVSESGRIGATMLPRAIDIAGATGSAVGTEFARSEKPPRKALQGPRG
ncbi:molybdenum ABC transporter ATP-binding protein [Bradyrhizobium cenepequi]